MTAILSTKNKVGIFDEKDIDAMAIEFASRFNLPRHILSIEHLAEYMISQNDHLDVIMQDGMFTYRKP